jgi:prevent-host-death family protein
MEAEMQLQIGAFEAKTHFSQILEKVEHGADFLVTRRGKPVAQIIPFKKEPKMTFQEALAEMQRLRDTLYRGKPGDENIRELIEAGRRY